MAKTWFLFTGSAPCITTNYILVGSKPTCLGSNNLCAIFAEPDVSGIFPEITESLCCEMTKALNMRADSVNVLLKT